MLSLVGVLAVNIVVWALEADTVEYGEWKTGVRTEGITYALFSFTRKTGQAVGGALAAYALALGGYKSGAAQTAEAVFGIQLAAGAIPAVLTIVAVARDVQVQAHRRQARGDPRGYPGPPRKRRRRTGDAGRAADGTSDGTAGDIRRRTGRQAARRPPPTNPHQIRLKEPSDRENHCC